MFDEILQSVDGYGGDIGLDGSPLITQISSTQSPKGSAVSRSSRLHLFQRLSFDFRRIETK